MSTVKGTDDELAGLKVSELKKLCKMNNLPTSGTKAELMGRILENKAVGSTFSALPPEEEARLLGDDDLEPVKVVTGNQVAPSSSSTITTTTADDEVEDVDDDAALDDLISVHSVMGRLDSTNSLTAEAGSDPLAPPGELIDEKQKNKRKNSVPAPVEDQAAKITAIANVANVLDDDDDDDEGPTVVKLRAVSAATDDERMAVRANRFGQAGATTVVAASAAAPHAMSDALSNEKLAARAKRFGLPIGDQWLANGSATVTGQSGDGAAAGRKMSDAERLKRRAERFGSGATGAGESARSGTGNAQSEAERKALRLQRFGAVSASTNTSSTKTSSSSDEEEKRKAARALKFGLDTAPVRAAGSLPAQQSEKLAKRASRFGMVG